MKGIVTNERLKAMLPVRVCLVVFEDDGQYTAVRIGRADGLAKVLSDNITFYCEAGHYASAPEPIDAVEALLSKAGIA